MDTADDALQSAAQAWLRDADRADASYVRWPEPGGYTLRGGTLGFPGADFVIWVAAAVGSGVAGNAAYDALRLLVAKVRERNRAMSSTPVLRADEVAFLARLSVRVALIHYGHEADQDVEVLSVAWDGVEQGDWRVQVRDRVGTFDIVVADQAPEAAMCFGRRATPHDG